MNASCDAAEQVVRMSLESTELAVKIVGKGAKKTKGKARLASLLKSGKELKVYSLPEGGLKKARKAAWLCKKESRSVSALFVANTDGIGAALASAPQAGDGRTQ